MILPCESLESHLSVGHFRMDFRFRGEDGSCSRNHRNAGFDPLQTWDVQCNRVSGCIPADLCQSDRPAIRPCVGEPYATRSIEATRRAKSLPMTDFLHPWPPPSIRGPFAEVAHEAPNHQRGWQVARRNRARSRPFFCQESRYSYGPLARCCRVTVAKNRSRIMALVK